jgi:cellobiose-specific phosphotransferase system component IIC
MSVKIFSQWRRLLWRCGLGGWPSMAAAYHVIWRNINNAAMSMASAGYNVGVMLMKSIMAVMANING